MRREIINELLLQTRQEERRRAFRTTVEVLAQIADRDMPEGLELASEVMRSRIGLRIQDQTRAFLESNGRETLLSRVHLGEGIILDTQGVNLYGPRIRIGHGIGNPPLGPDEWTRNYRAILDVLATQ